MTRVPISDSASIAVAERLERGWGGVGGWFEDPIDQRYDSGVGDSDGVGYGDGSALGYGVTQGHGDGVSAILRVHDLGWRLL